MPLLALALLALLIVSSVGLWLTFTIAQMLFTLAIAGLVGWLADMVVPGQLPYGWLGAVVAGLIGGWLGALLIGNVGPALFGVHILPAFVGATLLAGGVEVLGKRMARES